MIQNEQHPQYSKEPNIYKIKFFASVKGNRNNISNQNILHIKYANFLDISDKGFM